MEKSKKILLLSGFNQKAEAPRNFQIAEFSFDILEKQFISFSNPPERDSHAIFQRNLSEAAAFLARGGHEAVIGHDVEVMVLKYLLRRQGLPDLPALAYSFDPEFAVYEEIGEIVGDSHGENPAREIAALPNMRWLCFAREHMNSFSRYGIPAENISYVAGGSFLQSLLNPLSDEYRAHPPETSHPATLAIKGKILAAGLHNRDYLTLLEAAKDLPVEVFIITDFKMLSGMTGGAQAARLKAALESSPNARVIDWLPLDAYIACVRSAGAVVVPLLKGRFISGQLAVAEAQHLGRPVVAADLPAIRDFIRNGETGLLYEPENPESLRQKLYFLIKNPDAAQKIAEAGRRAEAQLADDARAAFLTALRSATKK